MYLHIHRFVSVFTSFAVETCTVFTIWISVDSYSIQDCYVAVNGNSDCRNVIILELPLLNVILLTDNCAVVCTSALVWCVFWALKWKSALLAMLNTEYKCPTLHAFLIFVPCGMSHCGVMLFCDDWYVLNKTTFPQCYQEEITQNPSLKLYEYFILLVVTWTKPFMCFSILCKFFTFKCDERLIT